MTVARGTDLPAQRGQEATLPRWGKSRALSSASPCAVSNSGTASVVRQAASRVSSTSNRSNERRPQNPRFLPVFVRPADQFTTGVGA